MKISVIVPFYNVGEYFLNCINSLLEQTYENLECVFVDDGSTDNSLEILNSKIGNNKNCIIIEQKNAGQSAARRAGFEASTGDYIAFLDADDWVDKDFYEKLYQKAKEGNYDITFSNTVVYENNIFKKENFIANQTYKNYKEKDLYKKYSKFIDISVLWNKLYKRELFKKNINYFPDIRKFEDNYFNFAIILSNPTIGYCFDTNIYYRIRENSVMTSIENIDECFGYIIENVKEIDKVVNSNAFEYNKEVYLKIADVYKLKIIVAWFKKLKNYENINYSLSILKIIHSRENEFIDRKARNKLLKCLNLNFLKRVFCVNNTIKDRIIYQILGFKIKIKI